MKKKGEYDEVGILRYNILFIIIIIIIIKIIYFYIFRDHLTPGKMLIHSSVCFTIFIFT